MKVIKTIFFMIAISMALTLLLSNKRIDDDGSPKPVSLPSEPVPEKRVSRFLQQRGRGNGRPADHCNKNEEICDYIMEGRNTTCCNNKCVDLVENAYNCGSCKKICPPTHACCRGQCVDLRYDKRHCGRCNNRCMTGGYCFYGFCDYA